MRAYPAIGKRRWSVAVEFHDGTRIEGVDDQDVLDRWRRLSEWDGTPRDPEAWLGRILTHSSAVYGADVSTLSPLSTAEGIIDTLYLEGALHGVQRRD
jgi:hypothetical protein